MVDMALSGRDGVGDDDSSEVYGNEISRQDGVAD